MFSVSCRGDDGASVFRIRLSVITDERTTTTAHEPARWDLITLTTGNKKQPTRRRRGIRAQLPRDSRERGVRYRVHLAATRETFADRSPLTLASNRRSHRRTRVYQPALSNRVRVYPAIACVRRRAGLYSRSLCAVGRPRASNCTD